MSYQEKKVVSCFLFSQGNVLIVRRSEKVGSYRGRWAGISGYIEDGELEQAYKEIEEETGLRSEEVDLLGRGKPLKVADKKIGIQWVIYPFLFSVKNIKKIKIDWEHVESRWIHPDQMRYYNTVPHLYEAFLNALKSRKKN